jgi:hypothetical protein
MKGPLVVRRTTGHSAIGILRRVWKHEATSLLSFVLVFTTVFSVGVYYLIEPSKQDTSEKATESGISNARLSASGVGQVLFESASSAQCRRMLFDNRSGHMREAGSVECHDERTKVLDASSSNRFQGARQSSNK